MSDELEEIILSIAHEASLIERGKTITADWFPEQKQDLQACIDSKVIEARIDEINKITDDLKDNRFVYWGDGSPSDLIKYKQDRIAALNHRKER